mgnify:CR=1 FL=1
MNDFLEEYNISNQIVDDLVGWYHRHEDEAIQGQIDANLIDVNVKDSKDIIIPSAFDEEPFYTYKRELHKCINLYADKFQILKQIQVFGLIEPILIQKYSIGGGFKEYHTERVGKFGNSIKRCLVFITYLNDVDDGGTEFGYYNKIVKAKKGKTLIFPVDWTHMHRGQVSYTKEKIIITGWYSYAWDY